MFKFLMNANKRAVKKYVIYTADFVKAALRKYWLSKDQKLSNEESKSIFEFIINQKGLREDYVQACVLAYKISRTRDIDAKGIVKTIVQTHYEWTVELMPFELMQSMWKDVDEAFAE